MKNKIRWRLLLYFAGTFSVFALIIGLVFSALFSRHTMNVYKTELEDRAVRIAGSLAGFWTSGTGQGHGGMGMGQGYGAYLRFADDIAMTDTWIVDRNLEQIIRGRWQTNLAYKDLPPGAEAVIAAAMEGKSTFSESFGAFLGAPSVTVATPITLSGGQVAGVVLLHEQIETIRSATKSGSLILILSIGVAISVSFFVARSLASHFTKPLAKMRTAALQISGGDYTAKTCVSQDDEIGELAAALDDMAIKLDTASKESAKLAKLRQDFVANISHELRTPVTVIRGSLEALCDGVVSEPKMVVDYHQQMLAESIYMERLVSDLIDLARLQNPDFAMDQREVDLKELTADAIRSIQRIADTKHVDVRLSYAGNSFIAFGDYSRLRQMLLILLDNAVKFSPEAKTVHVALSRSQSTITLSVADEGPGIAPRDLPCIFERFYKQRSEENKNGTGLGLAIAKQIADRHNANIEAKNRPYIGAEFVLTYTAITE